MYNDADGHSHFEDLAIPLEPRDFAPPAAPAMVAPFLGAAGTLFFGVGPGWGGETPHPSPQRQIFCIVRGVIRVTVSDGEEREFSTGDLILLDDTLGMGHSTSVVGGDDAVLFGVVLADQSPAIGPSR